MKRKELHNLFLLTLIAAFFISMWLGRLNQIKKFSRLDDTTITSEAFRKHKLDEQIIQHLQYSKQKGKDVAIYLLKTNFGTERTRKIVDFHENIWRNNSSWKQYFKANCAIWDDLKCFPVVLSKTKITEDISYENSWMAERTYGGKRSHEGVDIMAKKNEPGAYPIVSMTDGVVTQKGWLEKGGYRIGITSPSGGYFYYAHLDTYGNFEKGDEVKAGDILGFMGDSGYGPEGTTGKFPVHLHLGIYIYPNGNEISINPYWILRYLESHTLFLPQNVIY